MERSETALIQQRPDQTEEEFWAEHDPYEDRFSTPLPRWSCFVLLAVLGLILYVVVSLVDL